LSTVIEFLSKVNPRQKLNKPLHNVYGDSAPSYATVKNWVKEFRLGRESVEDVQNESRSVDFELNRDVE
jgi:hypothetical protein